MNAILEALRAVSQRKLLWLVHILGNAAALAAAWWWLGLPDETVWQVALSFVAALAIIAGVLWMHAAALAARCEPSGVRWMRALRRAALLLPWAAGVTGAGWAALRYVGPAGIRPGFLVVAGAFLILTPVGTWLANGAAPWCVYRNWRYYAGFAIAAGVACVPMMLLRWMPVSGGLERELASFFVRFGLAYVILVTDWLFLAALAGHIVLEARTAPVAAVAAGGA